MAAYKLRGVYPLAPKHLEVVDYLFEPNPGGVKQVDLCCGRGFGKSVLAIYIAVRALSIDGNQIGLFLEPDWKRVNRVFLKKWIKIVPKELYTINKSAQLITWFNGSLLFYGPRNVTGSYQSAEDAQVGQDTTFIVDDEAALRCSYTMYTNNLATVREPSPVRFYLTVSTPRVGPYKRLVTAPGHTLFRGVSSDNIYLPPGYVENLRENMSADQARREIDGEFVSLEGRIWKTWVGDKMWPNGNVHPTHTKFDARKPWYLYCDLGSATGSYVVVQQTDSSLNGRDLFDGPTWVIVADLCPRNDASASRAFTRLKAEFGTPAAVVAGDDINTRGRGDGNTVAYFAQNIFGNINIYPCDERAYSKRIQYDCTNWLVCSATGKRRLCMAKDFVSLEPDSRRGIAELWDEDEWPAEDKRRPGDILPKNKDNRVQHVRDALLMGAMTLMAPPQWREAVDPVG